MVATTRIEIFPGTVTPNAVVGFRTPVMSGKVAAHNLGGVAAADLVRSRRNMAPVSKAALGALRATPVQAASYLSFDADVNAIDTGVAETDAMTIMALFRRTPGSVWTSAALSLLPVAVSNLEVAGGFTRGIGIWINWTSSTAGAVRGGASWNDLSANPAQTYQQISIGTALDTWRIVALTVGTAKPTLYDRTLGTSIATATPATTTRAKNTGRNLLIGGAHSSYGGTMDVAFTQIWNRELNATEIGQEAAIMQTRAAAKGITVTLA